ncbi:unnamed protein product [Zymoseptoria tritici ST99CH_1E4]|uniref:JmjC domain-containing protein n=1 Tax=Zymoseptoria tritici ST99CH_1E4 TaxID=1276532 RepID=A0A2H1H950_ZYMTR|nr:unnamed protein product [Zymoseptoria tritici ST99CH_1E4]
MALKRRIIYEEYHDDSSDFQRPPATPIPALADPFGRQNRLPPLDVTSEALHRASAPLGPSQFFPSSYDFHAHRARAPFHALQVPRLSHQPPPDRIHALYNNSQFSQDSYNPATFETGNLYTPGPAARADPDNTASHPPLGQYTQRPWLDPIHVPPTRLPLLHAQQYYAAKYPNRMSPYPSQEQFRPHGGPSEWYGNDPQPASMLPASPLLTHQGHPNHRIQPASHSSFGPATQATHSSLQQNNVPFIESHTRELGRTNPNVAEPSFSRMAERTVRFRAMVHGKLNMQTQDVNIQETFQWSQAGTLNNLLHRTRTVLFNGEDAICGDVTKVKEVLRNDPGCRKPVFVDDPNVRKLVERYDISRVLKEKQEVVGNDKLFSVQDPSVGMSSTPVKELSLLDLMNQFDYPAEPSSAPLNVLDFAPATDEPTETLHKMLIGEHTLLPKLWAAVMRNRTPKAKAMAGGRSPCRWATFAESGALSAPHVDIDGLGTYITIAQGEILFLWCDSMNDAETEQWQKQDVLNALENHDWNCTVMEAGQSVVFPAGTPHAVIRNPGDSPTLSFGGHFLHPQQLPRFASLCRQQLKNPSSAALNEDPESTVWVYLLLAAKHVLRARAGAKKDWARIFGGNENVGQFFQVLKSIDARLAEASIKIEKPFEFRGKKRVLRRSARK